MQELGISKDASIISKFDPVLDHLDRNVMTRALDGSLQRLGVEQLNGMMLHKGEFLSIWNEGLSAILFDLVSTGKVKHLGISVALPEEAIVALNTEGIDMIQMPANIFDRRFEKAGVYELAKDKKKDVYLRSIFLQGLLLLEVSAIPGRISLAAPFVEKLDRLAEEYCLTRHEIALGYVKSAMPAARVVFGVETKEQVAENLAGWQKDVPAGLIERIKMSFPDLNERILNPHLW
jgi:aryl-alcohol dehydrogenase-like predicted oxidoreductase